MLQAVIFDLDGTLIDSEGLWKITGQQLAERHGKTYDPNLWEVVRGRGDAPILIRDHYQLSLTDDEAYAMNLELFNELIKTTLPAKIAGADALLNALQTANIPCGLATGCDTALAKRILQGHGWEDFFSAVVTLGDVSRQKPAPDLYQEAVRRLGQDASVCVAFEDSPAGVASAKATGIKVIGISDEPMSDVERVIRDFEEIDVDALHRLFE